MPGSPLLEALWRNIRHALCTLRSGKTWTAAAVLSLALGIGSSTALFSVFHNYALKPLPVPDPQELVALRWSGEPAGRRASHHYAHLAGADGARGGHTFPFDVVEQLRSAGRSLSGLLAFAPSGPLNAFAAGSAEFASGQFVSGNFHALLGVDAAEGRTLMPWDDDESADPVVVISHQYRVRRFGMDKPAVGEPVTINGMTFTVAGVSPPGFGDLLPRGRPDAPDLTIPLGLEPRLRGPRSLLHSRSTWWLSVMGRMKPEVRAETVEAELRVAFRQAVLASDSPAASAASSPPAEPPRLHVVSGRHGLSDPSRDTLRRLATVAAMLGLLLSIACTNVASLLLSRNAMRRREFAVRAAIGASRGRLMTQLLAESLLLAGLGGAFGLLAAHWLAAWAGAASPLPAGVTIVSAPALAFAAALTVAAAVLFGAGPALHATRAVAAPLAGRGFGTSPSPHPWRNRSLVAVQVALTAFLLAGAGLFLRTLSNLQQVELGIDPDNVVSFTVDPESSGYDRPRAAALYRRLDDRLSNVPGVRSVSSSAIGGTLLDGGGARISIQLDGRTDRPEASMFSVEHDFFDTLRIPLVLGRLFSPDDTSESPPVALVNQTFAREILPAGNPLGRRFRGGRNEVEVVGVVGDARVDSLRVPAPPTFYLPTTQLALPGRTVLVRTAAAPGGAVPAIRAAAREVDPQLPLSNIGPLVDRIGANHLGSERVMAFASSLFGVLALLTALAGLFGMTTCNVVRRTKEIGIRMALGATRGAVLRSVMGETLVTVGCGLFVGAAAAVALGRVVENQLFGLAGHDPATLLLAAAVTLSACMVAGYFPARRAARVDPMTVMRRD